MKVKTTDLCDRFAPELAVADPVFKDYGGTPFFAGEIATVQVYEDNILVRRTLEEPGQGRVLVVDGGGSLRCALVGGMIAYLAHRNGWAGILVYGCIRNSDEIARVPIGVKALNSNPLRPKKQGTGQLGIAVTFA
ncbi:MAG TPA: ribonuclease E activity regulator RraA, partial [Anaerolineae bacterium]